MLKLQKMALVLYLSIGCLIAPIRPTGALKRFYANMKITHYVTHKCEVSIKYIIKTVIYNKVNQAHNLKIVSSNLAPATK